MAVMDKEVEVEEQDGKQVEDGVFQKFLDRLNEMMTKQDQEPADEGTEPEAEQEVEEPEDKDAIIASLKAELDGLKQSMAEAEVKERPVVVNRKAQHVESDEETEEQAIERIRNRKRELGIY